MEKKKMPGSVRFLRGFLSVILCIILFACSAVTILVADLSLLTSKSGLQQLIRDVIFPSSAPSHVSAAIMPGRGTVRMNDASAEAQDAIVNALYEMLERQFGDELPIEKQQIQSIIEQSTLPDFLSDKVAGFVSDVISGESTTAITQEEVMELVEENRELLEETFQMEITQEMMDKVCNFVEESNITETIQQEISNITGITPGTAADPSSPSEPSGSQKSDQLGAGLALMDAISRGEVTELGISEALTIVRFITAPAVLACCLGACLLLFALLFLTNWGHPNAALRCCGIPVLTAGILFLIPTVVAWAAPALFAELGVAGVAVRQVLKLSATVSITTSVLGLALVIGGIVWGSRLKKKRATAAGAEVLSDALVAGEVPANEEAPAVGITAGEAPAAEETPASAGSDN